jgi:D-psicose/D-tagatose/L-ribulose 3-epimerase
MVHKIGVHGYGWTPQWDSLDDARRVVAGATANGIDFVEIPVFDPFSFDVDGTRALFENAGLGITVSFGLPVGTGFRENADGALVFLHKQLEVATALGATAVSGALYSALGAHSATGPAEDELRVIAAGLKEIAQDAAARGLEIGLEAINRYETYVLNTGKHLAEMIARIGEPNVFAHLDTFHMNIEETDFRSPIVALGPLLRYIHLSESHRGQNGTGTVNWDQVFEALVEIDYKGPLVIEMFPTLNPAMALATGLWRDLTGGDHDGAIARSIEHARNLDVRHFG